ncbi:MAG: peptidoglycan DD-metalloendopeptidase family protein, partial [Candidatus Aenigmarchaeota archaeon]|nr:peptidoglycan DD-metalloendopeptidase family protein [Candidatus Aenigmarchaeota archaeon]
MYRQSRKKGQVTQLDLLAVAIVFFVGLGLFMLADFLVAKNMIISRQTIQVSMDMDDRGSELVSLMGATSLGLGHMELAGDTMASNYETYVGQNLENLDKVTQILGSGYRLALPGRPLSITTTSSICIHDDPGSHPKTLPWPMPDVRIVSSQPGFRQLTGQPCRCHAGVDVPGRNKDVIAVASGRVRFVGQHGDYGKTVIITHDGEWDGYETLYGHLDSYSVSSDEQITTEEVRKGKKIGESGSTGLSVSTTGGDPAHLHFELRKKTGENSYIV